MWLPPLVAATKGWSPWAWKPATSKHPSLFRHVLGHVTPVVGIHLNKHVVQQFDTVESGCHLIAGPCAHVLAHGWSQARKAIQHSLDGCALLVLEQLVCVCVHV